MEGKASRNHRHMYVFRSLILSLDLALQLRADVWHASSCRDLQACDLEFRFVGWLAVAMPVYPTALPLPTLALPYPSPILPSYPALPSHPTPVLYARNQAFSFFSLYNCSKYPPAAYLEGRSTW